MIKHKFTQKALILALGCFILVTSCAGSPRFESSQTALLIIDIQNAYLPVYNQGVFIPNVVTLRKKAAEANVPVIFIRNLDGYNKEGSTGWKFHGALRPGETDTVIEKEYPSSFSDTELDQVLKNMGIKTLILTGLASSGCYGATVRDSYRLKYHTVVVSDAHADQTRGRAESLNNVLANYENLMIMETAEINFAH